MAKLEYHYYDYRPSPSRLLHLNPKIFAAHQYFIFQFFWCVWRSLSEAHACTSAQEKIDADWNRWWIFQYMDGDGGGATYALGIAVFIIRCSMYAQHWFYDIVGRDKNRWSVSESMFFLSGRRRRKKNQRRKSLHSHNSQRIIKHDDKHNLYVLYIRVFFFYSPFSLAISDPLPEESVRIFVVHSLVFASIVS